MYCRGYIHIRLYEVNTGATAHDWENTVFPVLPSNVVISDNFNIMSGVEVEQTCWTTHWGRVTHICVGNLTTIGSDNVLSPDRRQAIIWTNAGILLIGPLWTNFSEFSIKIPTFSFKKMRLKVSSAKWRSFCVGLNVLIDLDIHVGRQFADNSSKGIILAVIAENWDMISIKTHLHRIENSSWWRHEMKTFSALLALCAWNWPALTKAIELWCFLWSALE